MKKKTIISIVLIIMMAIPLFAFGAKEKSTSSTATPAVAATTTASTQSTSVATTPATTTATTTTASSASSNATTVATTATTETTTATTSTALSNPVYKVELTEATYITEEDIQSAIDYLTEYYGTEVSKDDATEYLIDQILFNQALVRAIQNNDIPLYDGTFNDYVSYQLATYASYYGIELTTTEEAEAFLGNFDITYEDFANGVLQDFAEQYYISMNSNGRLEAITEPTDDEITEFYNSNITYFISSEAVQLSHIYFGYGEDKAAAKVKADTAASNISKGLSFEDAVATYSEDEATKDNAGAFGVWISASDESATAAFGENAMTEIFKLAIGQVSGVIEGAQGYHILKVTDRKSATLLGLDDLFDYNYSYTVKDIIAQQLYSNKQTVVYAEIYNDILNSLKEEATIKSLK